MLNRIFRVKKMIFTLMTVNSKLIKIKNPNPIVRVHVHQVQAHLKGMITVHEKIKIKAKCKAIKNSILGNEV